jgi:hypothetical protein
MGTLPQEMAGKSLVRQATCEAKKNRLMPA